MTSNDIILKSKREERRGGKRKRWIPEELPWPRKVAAKELGVEGDEAGVPSGCLSPVNINKRIRKRKEKEKERETRK